MLESNIKITRRQGYMIVDRPARYTVKPDYEIRLYEQLVDACRQAHCKNVLMRGPDTRVNLSTMEVLDLGAHIADTRLNVAVAETHNASQDDVEFLQNVVWNRGGALRFFDSEREALHWLGVD